MLFPISIFLLTGINNQLIFHTVATLIGILLIKGTRVWVLLSCAILLLPIDRTFVTLALFLILVMALRVTKKWSLIGVLLIFLIFQADILPFQRLAVTLIGIEDLSAIKTSLERFNDGPIVSLGFLFISMVYLGGTSTILGFGPEYLAVLYLIVSGYFKMQKREEFHIYFLAFLATFFLVLYFTPTIQGYRYYVFIAPILIYYLAPKLRHQQIIVLSSILLSVAYLLQVIRIDLA